MIKVLSIFGTRPEAIKKVPVKVLDKHPGGEMMQRRQLFLR